MKKDNQQHKLNAQPFPAYEKSLAWFAVITLVFALVVIGSVALRHYMLTGILILAAIVYFLVTNVEPKLASVVLGSHFLRIHKRTFHYQSFKWFRVLPTPHGYRLELQPFGHFRLPIGLELGKKDPRRLIDQLASHIPWNFKGHETLSERLMRWLKI